MAKFTHVNAGVAHGIANDFVAAAAIGKDDAVVGGAGDVVITYGCLARVGKGNARLTNVGNAAVFDDSMVCVRAVHEDAVTAGISDGHVDDLCVGTAFLYDDTRSLVASSAFSHESQVSDGYALFF